MNFVRGARLTLWAFEDRQWKREMMCVKASDGPRHLKQLSPIYNDWYLLNLCLGKRCCLLTLRPGKIIPTDF